MAVKKAPACWIGREVSRRSGLAYRWVIGKSEAVRTLDSLSLDGLAVSIIAVAEVYEGAFDGPDSGMKLADYREFLSVYALLLVTDPIAVRFARLWATLRRQGMLIPDMDLLIAATALENDLTLVTRNFRHFDRITGLKLYR